MATACSLQRPFLACTNPSYSVRTGYTDRVDNSRPPPRTRTPTTTQNPRNHGQQQAPDCPGPPLINIWKNSTPSTFRSEESTSPAYYRARSPTHHRSHNRLWNILAMCNDDAIGYSWNV
ncbi:hypothetical protein LIPSTDRAFT_292309 [Lipomyces starkeyi NRRL Y-11557]|uniref:Uncharacterized protein n=1 Tax=Lipomyces starkeyi NRRL Y-11557 TaxID=675824 RepID=A0A1E3Q3P9_LIPST|nr:hypothetical protein LIPSTDRAFT_292309 [Lipomyces starkeyi NRRL Y-11557]